MKAEKLNKWAELLLDTGKRNNLIHFKDTKMGSVEILSPDFVTLFNRAEHSAVFEIYDPKLEDEEEEFDFVEDHLSSFGIRYGCCSADLLRRYRGTCRSSR